MPPLKLAPEECWGSLWWESEFCVAPGGLGLGPWHVRGAVSLGFANLGSMERCLLCLPCRLVLLLQRGRVCAPCLL